MRILIVEDNQETADSLQAYLRLMDFEVIVANTFVEARNLVLKNPFDVALVDWWAKGEEEGFKTLNWLRNNGFNQPVAIVTGADLGNYSDILKKVEPYSKVIAVQKPMDSSEVIEKLRQMI